jgi:hypothetical protein
MTDVPVERRCDECGNPNDTADYCPECGNGTWERHALYDFERDVDLPVVFPFSAYNDHYELWNSFCEAVWDTRLTAQQIANIPGLPRMKYSEFEVYWKLTEDCELTGPFMDREEAREA